MKRIWIIVGAVVALLVAAVVIVPQLIPSEVYRAKIEEEATKALGRQVKVGPVSVGIIPRIEAKAGASTIANPEGFGDAPFASMKELRAAVKLFPLFFGKVEIDEFVLVEPNIAMVQLADGRNNWTFEIPGAKPTEPSQPGSEFAGSLGDVRIENGQVTYDDRKTATVHKLAKLQLNANMDAIDKPFSIHAEGLADDVPFKVDTKITNPKAMMGGLPSQVTIKLDTDLLKTNLDGSLALGDNTAFDFKFDGEVPSATKLADAFQVKDLPARAVLGKISASGQALGTPSDITLKIADARHESALLNADLQGEARIAEFITLALTANAEAPKLADLATAMSIEAPAGEALGKASATTKIDGRLGDLTFSNVDFKHDSGLLGISFTGGARLNANLTYNGRLSIKAPDLRALAVAAGATLPPGDVYKTFSLTGDTSGGTSSVMLRNAVVQFDKVQGTGEAALKLGTKPHLTGSLSTNAIDITPYATASGAPEDSNTKKPGGWGSDPIDLSPLKLADADLTLKAAGIKYEKFDFGSSNILVTLKSGKLVADLKQTSLFGGAGGATLTADGSSAVPSVALKANISALSLKPLMNAAAGFDMVEGKGDIVIDIAGSGANLHNLMSSLAGNGKFAFDQGAINGVNLTELGNAAKTALSSKSISLAAFSKDAKTTFNGLNANFAMKDGVAVMADLKMDAAGFTVSGGGALDIGKQKLQLSLFPEFTDKKQGINGYGLPIKLAGGWDGVGLNLDWDWLAKKATSDVKAKVTDEIQSELKKSLGGDLGKLLGNSPAPAPAPAQTPAQTPAQPADPAATPAQPPAESPQSAEDRLKKEAQKALGKLFGD